MKRLIHIIIIVVSIGFVLTGISVPSVAASLDFGWGTPVNVTKKLTKSEQKTYVAWPIQISNGTGQRLIPHIDIVAVTNTGKQYAPLPFMKVTARDYGEIMSVSDLHNSIFPTVTRRAVAVFEEVDPKASIIHFYVGGLEKAEASYKDNTKYLRITYKKSASGWEWDGTSFLE